MKNIILFCICCVVVLGCQKTVQIQFSDDVLDQEYMDLDGNAIPFKSILSKYQDQQIVIDVWASWCKDCIVGLPEVRQLQNDRPNAAYVFLSADRNPDSWRRAIKKHQIQGDHYYLPEGTKGKLGKYVDIDWIPRYMIVDAKGHIELFEAIEADDPRLREILK